MPDPSLLYCDDEAIRVRCAGDFDELVPADQVLASGTDGAISLSSPWLLTSASVDFAAYGVAKGNIVEIVPDLGSPQHFAVDSVSVSGVVLRRIGAKASGIGQPPVTATTSGLTFKVPTFGPQIEDVSYDLNRRYGINDDFADRQASYLYDPRELRQACVLTILVRQYTNENRAKDGDFAEKARLAREDLSETLARISVHFGQLGEGSTPVNRFSTQYRR